MTAIDYVILVMAGLSVLIGVWRGFVREALSLLIWVLAFWVAYVWTASLEGYLEGMLSDPALRRILAFVVLFLAVHIVGFVVARLLSAIIKSIGLRGVDRVAGAGFGLVRVVVVVAVLVLLIGLTPMQQETVWQQSLIVPVFNDVLQWVQAHYPLGNIGNALATQGGGLF